MLVAVRPRNAASTFLLYQGARSVHIFTVAGQPVDRREMSGICQGLVQSPEAADETLRILCHRLGEIAALRRYGADNGDGPFRSVQVAHVMPARS